MEEQQRLEQINKLIEQISPLNYEKILLDTQLYFNERKPDRNEQEIQDLKTKIQGLHAKLTPIFQKLRGLQCQYEIEFQGELTRIDGTNYWNNAETRLFNLRTSCQVDTFPPNSWELFINDQCVNSLLMEVHQVIFQQFYSNFKILNIKRI